MTFDDLVGNLLGINFEIAKVYYDFDGAHWYVQMLGSSNHQLTATNRADALTEAETYLTGNGNKLVGRWTGTPNDDETGYLKAIVS